MKSLQSLFARKAKNSKMNSRGQVIDLVSGTVLGIMGLIFVIFAVLFAIAALNPSSFFTANSASANATAQLQQNLTAGVAQFGVYIPTAFVVLGVVLALAAILILILYVRRMQGSTGGTTGGL